jgi:hypothetical protein
MATNLTNTQIVNALGLPADILTSLQTAEGDSYQVVHNSVVDALVNKIAIQKIDSMVSFTNPFKKFDGRPISFGDTIENVFIDVPQGYKYDKDATDPFVKKQAVIKALYGTLNYQMQYQATITKDELKRACLSDYGFMGIIEKILSQLNLRKDIDEYTACIQLLNNPNLYADGTEIIDLKDKSITESAHLAAKLVHSVANDFALPSTENDKAGVLMVTDPRNILIVMKQSLKDTIDMDYLVGLFNADKIDIKNQIITVRSFVTNPITGTTPVGKNDLDMVIMDSNAFDNHDALDDSGSIYNPKGRYSNHFVDAWRMFGFKTWFNARSYQFTNAPDGFHTVTAGDLG